MIRLRVLAARALGSIGLRWRDDDLRDEIEAHLELLATEHIRRGLSPSAARLAARREFGGIDQTKETYRDARGVAFLETLRHDVRYALRTFRKSPGFVFAVLVSLSLGIGVNTAIFSALDALMFRTLPVTKPAQLFLLRPEGARAVPQFSYPAFQELRRAVPEPNIAAMSRVARMYAVLDGDSSREPTTVQLVSDEYFGALGLSTDRGRLLAPEDNRTVGGAPVAVISDGLWRRRFGASAAAIGRGLTIDGTHLTVIGIAPAGFSGIWLESPVDVWLPLVMQANIHYDQNYYNDNGNRDQPFAPQEQIRWLEVIARVRPNPSSIPAVLNAAFQQSIQRYAETIGDPNERGRFMEQQLTFEPFAHGFSNLRGRFASPLYALLGMAALVLLIACTNAANLLLARADARQREIAIRLSMGASRRRIVRQLLTECVLIVAVATIAGVLFAAWAGDVLVRLALASSGPLPFSARVDWRVLTFATVSALLTTFIFGLVPAFRTTNVTPARILRGTPFGAQSRTRFQQVLVASQVALALVLLVTAGLLVRTLRNYTHLRLGFEPEHVVSLWISPRASGYSPERLARLDQELTERVQAVPGVRSASVAVCGLLVGCSNSGGVDIDGYQPAPGERIRLQENHVGPNYFETVGMRLLEGRVFTDRDTQRSQKVAIVNQAMVRRYFQDRNPIGQRFGDGRGRFEIVGVVEDARVNRVQDVAVPMTFYPVAQLIPYIAVVEVRTTVPLDTISPQLRQAAASVDPELPVDRVTTLTRQVELNLTQERLVSQLASFFGALALGLAGIGLFGVMSYVVSRRRTEFGVRLALGAQPGHLLRAVLGDCIKLAVGGLAIGIPVVLVISRVVSGLLFGVTPTDPSTIAVAATLLAIVAVGAGLLPAWRAGRVDPIVTLRCE